MTDFVDADVQAALNAHLATPNLGYPIAFQLVPFTPIDGVAFLQVWPLLKTNASHPGISYSDSVLQTGIFQVDAVMPDGQGEAPGLRVMALIADRFVIGTTLVVGTRRLQINAVPQTGTAIKDGAWVRFPVTIAYTIIT